MAAIRRPSWADWALNRAAETQPDLAGAFADAADAMRDAQTAAVEGRRADVAGALRTLRDRTSELVKRANAALAGAGRPPDIAEVTERLAAVAADPSATAQLRVAVLRSGEEGGDAIVGLPSTANLPPPRSAPKAVSAPARRTKSAPPAEDDAPAADDGAVERAVERRRLMREVADVERAQRTAAHELARTRRAVDDAETRRAAAAAALARAQGELDEADQRLAAVTERRTTLERELADAEQRAVTLHAALDRLAVDH